MINDREERALIALLAKGLLPEAQDNLTDEQAAALLSGAVSLSDEEKAALANMDPLAFQKRGRERGEIIEFPGSAEELPYAVGFNRQSDDDANEAILRKRKELVEKLKQEKQSKGNDLDDS